jgi:hypothetical protein
MEHLRFNRHLFFLLLLASFGYCVNTTPPGYPTDGMQFGLRFTGEIANLDFGTAAESVDMDSLKTDSDYGFGFGFVFLMPFDYFDLVPEFILSARWTSVVWPKDGYVGLDNGAYWDSDFSDPIEKLQHWELIAEATVFVRLPLSQFVSWLPLYIEAGPRGSLVPWSEILRNGEKPFKGMHFTKRIPVEVGLVGGAGISLWNHINLDFHYSHALTDFSIDEDYIYAEATAWQWEMGLTFLF